MGIEGGIGRGRKGEWEKGGEGVQVCQRGERKGTVVREDGGRKR